MHSSAGLELNCAQCYMHPEQSLGGGHVHLFHLKHSSVYIYLEVMSSGDCSQQSVHS